VQRVTYQHGESIEQRVLIVGRVGTRAHVVNVIVARLSNWEGEAVQEDCSMGDDHRQEVRKVKEREDSQDKCSTAYTVHTARR
jgi:hypothetical protein